MWLLVMLNKCFKMAEVIHTGAGHSKLGPQTQSKEKERLGQAGKDWQTFISSPVYRA